MEFRKKKKFIEPDSIPVLYVKIDPDDNSDEGIDFVSFVLDPAIEQKGMYFNRVEEEKKRFEFKVIKEQMKVVGPAMIPDMKILRKDKETGYDYYVIFTKDVIEEMVNKFNRNNSNRKLNVDHSPRKVQGYIQQNWIVSDPDKSQKYGFELPEGSWFIEVKIEDQKFWDEDIKKLGKIGFSIEGKMELEPDGFFSKVVEWGPDADMINKIDELSDKEVLDMLEDISKFNLRVGFDYDGTLSTPKGQKLAKKYISEGYDVVVVTKRDGETQSNDVYSITDKLGIPRQNVHFTSHMWKYREVNDLNLSIFYDDQQVELDKIKRNTNTQGILFS